MWSERQHQIQIRTLLIILLSAGITLWGLGAIYQTLSLTGGWERFLLRQSMWALVAWGLFFIARKIPFDWWLKYAELLTAAGILMLALLPFFGTRINGMVGWYDLGILTVQPSELIKAFYLLILIKIMHHKDWSEHRRVLLALGLIGIFTLLVLGQPDLGTAIVFVLGGLGVFFFCKVNWRYWLWLVCGLTVVGGAALLRYAYMRSRIWHFIFPDADPTGGSWHLRQFATAVARGEWFGVKGEMAVWSNSFLPLAHNDSIFAALCEILGFFGSGLLLLLYSAWFWQIFSLGAWQRNPVKRCFIDVAGTMLLAQTLLHILVNLSLLPPTGITLPLISYGGSSLAGTLLMLGIALSGNGGKALRPISDIENL